MKYFQIIRQSLLVVAALGLFAACGDKGSTSTVQNENSLNGPVDGTYPIMTFDADFHDFGEIEEGTKVMHTFKFVNEGDKNLIITNVKASCGCTTPSWPKQPIAPGESGSIPVEFDSKGRIGLNDKIVTITANTQTPRKEIKFRAVVVGKKTP